MKAIELSALRSALEGIAPNPRVLVSGNFATPYEVLAEIDKVLPEFRLHMLNAHGEIPGRDGVHHETSFVGPAMRNSERLDYFPARLSMVDRKSTRLNSSHIPLSRMPSSA